MRMSSRWQELVETGKLMLKLGFLAFGGPSAHIAMLEDEVVERRGWMSRQHFLDLVGATSLIPGPNSTQMMLHVGFERSGWPGLLIAGLGFILPAALITGVLAALYQAYGTVPEVEALLWGIKPAVLVIIFNAVLKLGRKALKTWRETVLGVAALVAVLAGLNELLVLFVGAVLGAFWLLWSRRPPREGGMLLLPGLALSVRTGDGMVAAEVAGPTLQSLGLFFLKVGAVLYGSGYVLIAFIEGDLVERWGWLTSDQLLDAIAIGQMTPGPLLTTATFIGYLLLGVPGAVVSTVAIFLPSVVLVGLLNPVVEKMRSRAWSGAFLDSVNAVALALMAAVIVRLAFSALTDWRAWLIAGLSAFAIFRFKIHSAWLIPAAAVLGYLLHLASTAS